MDRIDEGQAALTDEAKERAAAAATEAREAMEGLVDRVETFIRARPGTALLVALGAGYLVGKLVSR